MIVMPDFSNLKVERNPTTDFTYYEIKGEPVLTVKHAGESNKPFFNEQLRFAEGRSRRRSKMSPELVRALRDRDRELYPKFVITGWKNVKDANGVDVPFSQADCEAFLKALDDDTFDVLRAFCADGTNFYKSADGTELAGNSQTA